MNANHFSALGPVKVFVVATALLVAGCPEPSTPPDPDKPPAPPNVPAVAAVTITVHAAYTLLAPGKSGPVVIARVVVDDGQACPTLSGGVSPIVTKPRAKPAHPVHFGKHFPVTVCEAVVPFDQAHQVDGAGIRLGAARQNPGRVLVYGDTGCKHCEGVATPFDQLATAGAGLFETPSPQPPGWSAPGLILHMGDMNYRGTGWSVTADGKQQPVYDAGDMMHSDTQCRYTSVYYSQNAGDSTTPDVWENWNNDFFLPAQDLLPKAPWVFARGNHELCSRAGPGWFYFLGPGADGLADQGAIVQTSCPDQGSLASPPGDAYGQIVSVDTYAVDLGSLRVVTVDSANACDGYAENARMNDHYKGVFEDVASLVPDATPTWLVTHRPIWGIEEYKASYARMNAMMQKAIADTTAKTLPAAVMLSFGGHQHNFESITFAPGTGRPPQIVVGNSGVSLSGSQLQGNFCLPIDGLNANGNAAASCDTCNQTFGFLDFSRRGDGSWSGPVSDPEQGTTVATCDSSHYPVCTLTEDLGGSGCATGGS